MSSHGEEAGQLLSYLGMRPCIPAAVTVQEAQGLFVSSCLNINIQNSRVPVSSRITTHICLVIWPRPNFGFSDWRSQAAQVIVDVLQLSPEGRPTGQRNLQTLSGCCSMTHTITLRLALKQRLSKFSICFNEVQTCHSR
jgi:hypothetical protein